MLGGCAEVSLAPSWQVRQVFSGELEDYLVTSDINFCNCGMVAYLRGVLIKPESIALQEYVPESLLGMGVVSPDLVLVVPENGDRGQDANDRDRNHQFDECEAFCSLVGWMLLHKLITKLRRVIVTVSKEPTLTR